MPSTKPSSNWLALQKTLVQHGHPRKQRKVDRGESSTSLSSAGTAFPRKVSSPPLKQYGANDPNEHVDLETTEVKNGESMAALRKMVLGKVEYTTSSQTAPGKYLALDCEMVGVGIEGNESSLARVSIVNYAGAVVLDVFVRQRERVIDYRTQWSGVRRDDLGGSAKPFKEVQQTVADLIKDRILVGHAVHNDVKALLLSHPSPQIRDTQSLAYKHRVVKSRRPALRVLVNQQLGIVIQGGEHNSVTDARATMALFRLYKKQWESNFRPLRTLAYPQSRDKAQTDPASKHVALSQSSLSSTPSLTKGRKREHSVSSEFDDDGAGEGAEASSSSSRPRAHSPLPLLVPHFRSSPQHIPKLLKQKNSPQPPPELAQRKGISSGVSIVTRRTGGTKEVQRSGTRTRDGNKKGVGEKKTGNSGEKWWESLGGGGKKGSLKL